MFLSRVRQDRKSRSDGITDCQNWQDISSESSANQIESIETAIEVVDGRQKVYQSFSCIPFIQTPLFDFILNLRLGLFDNIMSPLHTKPILGLWTGMFDRDKMCQSRTISTVEIFRMAFLCRLPVRSGYKHIHTHTNCTFINHKPKWRLSQKRHTGKNTWTRPAVFQSHLSAFGSRGPVRAQSGLCQLTQELHDCYVECGFLKRHLSAHTSFSI